MLSECSTTISNEEILKFESVLPQLMNIVRTKRRLKDPDLDQFNLFEQPPGVHVSRDDKVAWQQHSFEVTLAIA